MGILKACIKKTIGNMMSPYHEVYTYATIEQDRGTNVTFFSFFRDHTSQKKFIKSRHARCYNVPAVFKYRFPLGDEMRAQTVRAQLHIGQNLSKFYSKIFTARPICP